MSSVFRRSSFGQAQATPQLSRRKVSDGSLSTVKPSTSRLNNRSGSKSSFIPSRRAGSTIGGKAVAKNLYCVQKFSDPAHLEECRRIILTFAEAHPARIHTSDEKLKNPTTDHFKNLFQQLYRYILVDYRAADKGFENEVPKILRDLKCPIDVKKSSVQAVAHSWPVLLTALRWIVEVIQYALEVKIEPMLFQEDLEDMAYSDSTSIQEALFIFHGKSYNGFLHGSSDAEDAYSELEKQLQINDFGLKVLEMEKERLLRECELYETKKPADEAEREIRERLKFDYDNCERETDIICKLTDKLKAELGDFYSEKEVQLERVQKLETSIAQKKKKIDVQTIPVHKAQTMHLRTTELTSLIRDLTKETDEITENIDRVQMECSKNKQDINSLWLGFRKDWAAVTKTLEQDERYVLNVDKINLLEPSFTGDLSAKLKNYLSQCINELRAKKLAIAGQKYGFQCNLDQDQENFMELKQLIDEGCRDHALEEQKFESDKQAHLEELKKLRCTLEFNKKELNIRERSFETNHDCDENQSKLNDLLKRKENTRKCCELEFQEIQKYNRDLLELAIAQRKQHEADVKEASMRARACVGKCAMRLLIDEGDLDNGFEDFI